MINTVAVPTEKRAQPLLPTSRSARLVIVAVLLLAFAARAMVVISTRDDYAPVFDAQDYDLIASSLAAGEGYGPTRLPFAEGATALRAPAYPASLALVYLVAGEHSWTAGRLANAAIGTLLVALVGLLGVMLFGRRVGLIAMVLAAAHPTLILHTSGLQLEPLLGVFELGTLAAVLHYRGSSHARRWLIVAGVLLGLGVLTREIALALLPPVVLLLWTAPRRVQLRQLAAPAVVLGIAVLTIMPWTIRNAVQLGGFAPVTSGFGFNLAGTYNQTARDYERYPATWLAPTSDPTTRAAILALPKRTEITTDRAFRTTAFTYIRQHPTYVGEVVFWNTVRLFDMQGPDHALFITQRLYPPRLTRISVYASYVVDAFALGALFLASVRRSPKAFWVFPVTAGVGLVLVSANIRYRASIEPFLVLLAAAAIAGLLERIPRRSWPDRSG